jgi:DHA1 family bicyclomycin/chloramphenicol resistance-like MFS transporter
MSLPGIPGIESGLGALAGQGTLVSSMFVAGFAATPLIGGALSDCFGRARVQATSLACFALMAFGCASATSLPALLLFRVLQGCASGIATTLPLAIVRDLWSGGDARQAMSEISMLSGFMPVLAPTLGTWAVHLAGWRLLFAAQGIFGGGVAVAAAWFPESLPVRLRQPLDLRLQLRNGWAVISEPTFRSCALVYGLLFACTFSFTAVSPLILIQRFGVHRATYALILAVNACASISGAATSTLLSRQRIAGHHIIRIGLLLVACGTLTAVVLQWSRLPVTLSLLPFVFIALFGFNLAGPSLLIEALRPVPHLLGSGSGMIRTIFMLINSLASSVLGIFCARHLQYAEKATGLAMAMLALGAVLLYARPSGRSRLSTAMAGRGEP